jgi:DNA-binding MarR family transcriptional regulator
VGQKDWTDSLLERWAEVHAGAAAMEPYQVTARISRVALHVARLQEDSFGKFGLNRGEVGVLSALRLAAPKQQLSPTRLFKGLMLSSAGITSRLDRLERRGYVKRTRHPEDRRGVIVELTESGREVLDQAVGADIDGERNLVAGLSPAERRSLGALLKKLLASLESNSTDGES